MRPAAAGATTSASLLVVYVLTLAPGVTFWDAGELIAAVETLGIPHPPGTPLWVLIARAWSDVLGFLPRAFATNLLSAAAVSAACGLIAGLMARWTRVGIAGLAAGLTAGSMSTVWLNATETEVYALVLLHGALMLHAGDRAAVSGEGRWVLLLAYLIVLAVPLHLAALVAAPAAIVLAAHRPDGVIHWRTGALLGALALGAAALGTVSVPLILLAAAAITAAVLLAEQRPSAAAAVLVGVLALLPLLYLPLRAVHDPWLNTQNPVGWEAFWELVGRRQYGEHPLWPRRAPAWAQLGMIAQYAEWQIALGISPGIVPSVPRVAAAMGYVALAVVGARWHRAVDRRSWWTMMILLLSGTLALVIYLNFRAGPTFGHGLLPPDAEFEARERDYFFLIGFWSWGAWAGLGAIRAAMALRRGGGAAGLAIAALPVALNWNAVDRRREPQASLPMQVAAALLQPLPHDAVLVTVGDNDTYPAWYLQAARGVRPDVTVIVSPMLNAPWYRRELARRHRLLRAEVAADPVTGEHRALRELAAQSAMLGRPFVVASTMERRRRQAIAREWTLTGMHLEPRQGDVYVAPRQIWVDSAALRARAAVLPAWTPVPPGAATDPTNRLMSAWLDCPSQMLALVRDAVVFDSLATVCKL